MESDKVSVHPQDPFHTGALDDLQMILPVSVETIDRASLSHSLGTCRIQTTLNQLTASVMFDI